MSPGLGALGSAWGRCDAQLGHGRLERVESEFEAGLVATGSKGPLVLFPDRVELADALNGGLDGSYLGSQFVKGGAPMWPGEAAGDDNPGVKAQSLIHELSADPGQRRGWLVAPGRVP